VKPLFLIISEMV